MCSKIIFIIARKHENIWKPTVIKMVAVSTPYMVRLNQKNTMMVRLLHRYLFTVCFVNLKSGYSRATEVLWTAFTP